MINWERIKFTKMTKKINIKNSMLSLKEFPVINKKIILKEAIEEMSNFKLGVACVIDANNKLEGIITDGDIRRKILKVQKPFSALLNDDIEKHYTKNPISMSQEDSLMKALKLMQKKRIWDLPIKDKKGRLTGLLHFHSIIRNILNSNIFNLK